MNILQNKYQEHKNLIITDHYGFKKYIITNKNIIEMQNIKFLMIT